MVGLFYLFILLFKDSAQWLSFTHWICDVTDKLLLFTIVDNTDISEIQPAMKGFESNTCIRFIPRQSQEAYLSLEPTYGWVSE